MTRQCYATREGTASLFPPPTSHVRRLVMLLRRIRGNQQPTSLADGTSDYELARELETAGRVRLTCYSRRKGLALYRAVTTPRTRQTGKDAL